MFFYLEINPSCSLSQDGQVCGPAGPPRRGCGRCCAASAQQGGPQEAGQPVAEVVSGMVFLCNDSFLFFFLCRPRNRSMAKPYLTGGATIALWWNWARRTAHPGRQCEGGQTRWLRRGRWLTMEPRPVFRPSFIYSCASLVLLICAMGRPGRRLPWQCMLLVVRRANLRT